MSTTAKTVIDPCQKEPWQDALDACTKYLCIEKPAAFSAATAAYTEWLQGTDTYADKKKCYLKAKCTLETYLGMDYATGLLASTKSEAIKKCVAEYVKKDDELAAALKQAAKTLKTLKEKIAELKAEACKLDTCANDSCNAQQVSIINKALSDLTADPPIKFDLKTEIITKLRDPANNINQTGDDTFMDAVEVTGIQTFISVDSLVEKGNLLCEKVKAFKGDLDTNIKDRTEEVKTKQGELANSIIDLSGKSTAKRKLTSTYEGLSESLKFVCDPTKPGTSIEEICDKVKNIFCKPPDKPDDEDDGSPKPPEQPYSLKQRPPARASQAVAAERL